VRGNQLIWHPLSRLKPRAQTLVTTNDLARMAAWLREA